MTWSIRIATLTLTTFPLLSCVYTSAQGQALENRVYEGEAQRAAFAQDLVALKSRVESSEEKTRIALDQTVHSARSTGAQNSVNFDRAIDEVAKLRGLVGELQHRLGQLELPGNTGTATPQTQVVPDDPNAALSMADSSARSDVAGARRIYGEILRRWPTNAVASSAHYGLGESYFWEQPPRCREALYEYGKVIQDFSTSPSAPMAYVRSADCFRSLNMTKEGRVALETVRTQFPGTEGARIAQQRLADWGSTNSQKR